MMDSEAVLNRLAVVPGSSAVCGADWIARPSGPSVVSYNPATGAPLAEVLTAGGADYDEVAEAARESFLRWRSIPAPARGEFVRRLGDRLRRHKRDLGLLVTLECGKILSEGEGEVQEMIDMCDFATGLSRQLHGMTIASERPEHRMFEQWHPLGPVGCITAFNFPVAVWAWNAAIAAVCGDTIVWKPSPHTPLTALAVQHMSVQIAREMSLPQISLLCADRDASVATRLAHDPRFPLISATGSCAMGRSVAQAVAARLGRTLLELGGNNAIIITEDANLDLALHGVLFAAVGTAGQRCTTLRRLIIHENVAKHFLDRLVQAYSSITIGDPWDPGVLMGPLIHATAVDRMMNAVEAARHEGGEVLVGGERISRPGNFVQPTIVMGHHDMRVIREETFAPILYALRYRDLDHAIAMQNSVPQGLSSAIFTERLASAERFLSSSGSDCGIANVNIGTSGAEIGGAFGGEKDTGGGREAGSDAWKAYMRRQTCTINYGRKLPLAQGVRFDLPASG